MTTKKQQFLAALLLTSALICASCGQNDAAASDTVSVDTEAQTTAETLSPLDQTVAALPEADFGGYEFTFMDRGSDHTTWYTYDIFAESENGDAINDAVFQRNRILEELYNIKIGEIGVISPATDIKPLIMAGDNTVDVFTDGLSDLKGLTIGNMLYDFNDISEVKLDQPWWDQQMRTELSIAGKNYFATGDISIMDNEGTWCILFNKKMVADYDLGDPYALVNEGTWTIDKMYEMAKAVAKDVNGDGKMTVDDQFGYLTESYNIYALWVGGNNKIIDKDDADLPISSMNSERSVSTYDKVLELHFDDTVSAYPGTAALPGFEEQWACFMEGCGLFIYGAMGLISDFRESDTDFGILPSPKLDAAQENYCNTFSCYNMTAYAIPATASDVSRIGTVLESMAQISQHLLTPAYIDVSLKGKFIRDSESEDMIELILATRSYDLGSIFQWGTSFSIFGNATKSRVGTFASQVEKCEKSLNSAIQKYVDQLNAAE